MINYESKIIKALKKVRKVYSQEYLKDMRDKIYVEVDSITVEYDENENWAIVTLRWGVDGAPHTDNMAKFCVYGRYIPYLVGYILGVMQSYESIKENL